MEALYWGLLRSLKFAKFKEKKIFRFPVFSVFSRNGNGREKKHGSFCMERERTRIKNMGRFVRRLAKPKSNYIKFLRCVIFEL